MTKLRGKNQIKRFEETAERLTSEIQSHREVAGIVFIGGLIRGFVDGYSDVDIIVLLNGKNEMLKKSISKLGPDEQKRSRVDVDLEVHFFEDFARVKWNETDRWDFSQAQIAFDPRGKVDRLFKNKLRVHKGFWTKRIVTYAEYLKWYCCPSKEGVGTIAEAWIARGDLASAHYCLSYSLDLMISVLFALNRSFLPPQKWRIYYSYSLKWLPKNYRRLVEEVMLVKSLSEEDLKRRQIVLRKLWRQISSKIYGETGMTTSLMSRLFVRKILHQS